MKLYLNIGQILGINLAALSITYVDVEDTLKIISLCLAIIYTTIQIVKEKKK